MQLTARFYASQVRKTAETLGIPLPAALVEQLDHADRSPAPPKRCSAAPAT
ncbi:hypothetical protein JOF57_004529 [Mycolicibacterium lutetiense]|uniref:Uncharacterized protein n=1 Tax=Mycolicibacterium lutetiense TaxID=1641992 RepID=A0ABS4ZZL6_9MYCO|nr:hypothetical protein [Mycolicibacterium lutetiense]